MPKPDNQQSDPPLPSGYSLDVAEPPLPAGYTLDTGVSVAPPQSTATQTPGYFKESLSAVGRLASNIAAVPKSLLTPHDTYGATRDQEVKMGPTGRLLYNIPADVTQSLENSEVARQRSAKQGEGWAGQTLSYLENSLIGPVVRKAEEAGPGHAKLSPQTVGATIEGVGLAEGPRIVGQGVGKGLKTVAELRKSVAPVEVPVAGEKVPMLVGEAKPGSMPGRIQESAKRSGAGAQKFKDFSTKQQGAVKQVVRNTAQRTSGMTGPMQDEPAAAMADAANTSFERARPMYRELDKSLVTVPDSLSSVSKITEQAIARARKLGVEVTQGSGENVVIDGRKFTPETDPEAWANFKQQGMVPDNAGQPISTYMKVRSQLGKMKNSASDPAMKYAIQQELDAMNANMDQALRGTPLYDHWTQANRLWSKGYAVDTVADAIRDSTKGTPSANQAPGIEKVPTTVVGKQLVSKLNDLSHEGVLDKAFTPEESQNLRQAADILDRASSGTGQEFGFGYGWHSTLMRNLVKLPATLLVKAMTTTDGVNALRSFASAKNAAEAQLAIDRFARLTSLSAADAGDIKNRKDALTALGK